MMLSNLSLWIGCATAITLHWFTAKAFVPTLIHSFHPLQSKRKSPTIHRCRTCHFGILSVDGPFSSTAVADVWGRNPLLIRNAFDSTELLESTFWPSWDNVMELASDVDAGSRLIRHQPGQLESFTMDLGPFAPEDLRQLSSLERDGVRWTVVVNDVDRFYTPLTDWMDETFGFLPRWRRDDGQISLAGKGGGIGPHVDNYDVFLIQTSGVRVWEIGNVKLSVEDEINGLIPGLDVRILESNVWKAQGITRLELRPGDLLYLPPRTIHCGTALSDDCMTLSVGCRTPAASELASRVVEILSTSVAEHATRRYVDHDLLSGKDSSSTGANGLLSKQVRDRMKQLVLDAVADIINDDLVFDEVVGRLVTEPKRFRENYPVSWEVTAADCPWETPQQAIDAARQGTACFFRAEGISFAFSNIHIDCEGGGSDDDDDDDASKTIFRLFVDGEVFELEERSRDEASATRLLSAICSSPFDLNQATLNHLPPHGESLLEKLLLKGFVYVAPEDDGDNEEEEEYDDD